VGREVVVWWFQSACDEQIDEHFANGCDHAVVEVVAISYVTGRASEPTSTRYLERLWAVVKANPVLKRRPNLVLFTFF
jgi:hypothetical protein